MKVKLRTFFSAASAASICLLFLSHSVLSQSTGAIQGTVLDASSSPVPNASVHVRNQTTGADHSTNTDSAGIYLVPSLPVGNYQVEVKATGLQTTVAKNVELSVGSTLRQDFTLKVASTSESIEVQGAAPLIEATSSSLGSVVNQHTVQEIPLNGRHFIDLSYLTVGTVTPPATGFLTAPLRGQGSFSFNSAGAREDSVNFMINGINLSDPIQNQITFQPTINTVEEARIDNSTFSAEYGRNSGSIVNIATKSGTNTWHGEAYDFLRNSWLDARNYSNPKNITVSGQLVPNKEAQFIRNQFGGDGGGAFVKDKFFVYLSYEGLRQRQAVPLSATVLTPAQRAQAASSSDSIVNSLLPLIPLPNSGTNGYAGSASAPVNISQGTASSNYIINQAHRLGVYYAIQKDQRNEPPATDGNSFPGGGDQRNGSRQLLTVNEVWTLSPSLVNEFRIGGNRIHITFVGNNNLSASTYGINSGVTAAIGIPQITVSGAFTFGGVGGFPQGRGDNVVVLSDTLSWIHGNHTLKFGGEFRRQNSDNFSYTPGTFSFPSITAFLADQANSFTANTSNRSNRTYGNSLGLFATDTWKISSSFSASLGLRYDWYGTPTEAQNRFVIFDPVTDTLQHVGQGGSGPAVAYNQSALNFEPRVGFVWDPFKEGKTIVRGSYALMTDQPTIGLVTGLASNPPYAFPVSSTGALSFGNAYTLATGAVAPTSIAHSYKDAYVSQWNFNLQQQFHNDYLFTASYVGSKGTDLNVQRNYNQFKNGVRPYAKLSASSPIDPGFALGNILVYESVGNSSYQAMWLDIKRRFSNGFQFDSNYSWSKSIDENSRNNQGLVIQDSNNIHGDRGLSDFNAGGRFVVSGIYELPFKGNRLKSGWQLSAIETLQSGSPLNFRLSNTSFAGAAVLRPNVTGGVVTGYGPATVGGAATAITYIDNPSVFINQGTTPGTTLGFGNLGRNVVTGPGFADMDLNIVKNTRLNERVNVQIRADVYDFFNHANFTNPVTTIGSATLGIITSGTRFPAGDFGSSRQIQLAFKLQF
jgi:hypothetical protein